ADGVDDIVAAGKGTVTMVFGGQAEAERRVETAGFDGEAAAVAAGNFLWDRAGESEVAVLDVSGTLHTLARAGLDTRQRTIDEVLELARRFNENRTVPAGLFDRLRRRLAEVGYPEVQTAPPPTGTGWRVVESREVSKGLSGLTSTQATLLAGHFAGLPTADLVVVSPDDRSVRMLFGSIEPGTAARYGPVSAETEGPRRYGVDGSNRPPAVTLDVEGSPIAVLSMRLNIDSRPDLVLLRKGDPAPSTIISAPLATFPVTVAGDTSDGLAPYSLRDAVLAANASAGPDMITVPAGTYTLSLGTGDDDAIAQSATTGDLDSAGLFFDVPGFDTNDLTVTGAGSGSTFIQAGTTASNGIDRIFDIDPPFGGSSLGFNISGVTLENGRAPAPNGAGGDGGAIRFLGSEFIVNPVTGPLAVTSCVLRTNTSLAGPGGAINIVFGKVDLTSASISSNSSTGGGGGVLFDAGAGGDGRINSVSSSYSGNAATGTGGGLYVIAAGNVSTVSGVSAFSGNTATVDGGALVISTANNSVTVTGASFAGNMAGRHGGAAWCDPRDLANTAGLVQFTSCAFDGNGADSDLDASGDGGGIFIDRGAVTISSCTFGATTANSAFNGGALGHSFFGPAGSSNVATITVTGGSYNLGTARGSGGALSSDSTNQDGAGTTITLGTGTLPALSGNRADVNGGCVSMRNGGLLNLASGIAMDGNTANFDGAGVGDGGAVSIGGSGATVTCLGSVSFGATTPNQATRGGAIAVAGGTFNGTAGTVTIQSNSAVQSGGGIFVSGGVATLNGAVIQSNSAPAGGGFAIAGGTLTLTRSAILSNLGTANGGGGLQSAGALVLNFNRFFGNTSGDASSTGFYRSGVGGGSNITNNWWGCNGDPDAAPGCQSVTGTSGAHNPRMVLTHSASPSATLINTSTTLIASVLVNSAGSPIAVADAVRLIGLPITFSNPVLGTISSPQAAIQPSGTATATFNAGAVGGLGSADATVDNATATATITIQEPPTITCPANVSTNADTGVCTASFAFAPTATGFPTPTVTCQIGLTVITSPFDFPVGSSTVNCTASNGVLPDASCSFTVTVADTQAPTLTCPANVTQPAGAGTCAATVNFTLPAASDNCPGATVACLPAPGSSFPLGSTVVTCTATDAAGLTGTCTFTVTVTDTQPPALTCPANVNAPAGPGQCSATVTYTTPTGTDNCPGAVTVNCSPASGSSFPVGATTVTCTATDAASLTATCTFTVTVVDSQPPTVVCPANVTVGNTAGQCSAVVNFATPAASDNCPGSTVACLPPSGSSFPVGTTTVTCTASDASSNTGSCSFTVTVNDTQAPTLACPANVSVPNTAGQCSAVVAFSTPAATDNCPGTGPVTCVPATGATFPVGTTTVTCTATDASSNTGSCSFTVTVTDTQAPALTCPANVSAPATSGQCSASVSYTVPVASDNCPGATVTCVPASGSTFPVGTTTVTCTATDASSNSNSCSFTVTVVDNQAPTIACPANITVVESPPMSGSAIVSYATPAAVDNCPGATVSCAPLPGTLFLVGTTTVTCTATDASSNIGTCTFTVTVQPSCMIACPANVTVGNDAGQCGASVSYVAPTTTGSCGVVTCTPASGSTFAVGTTTVNCTTTSGPSCSFTVTVLDTEAPSVTCPPPVTVGNTAGQCSAVVVYAATATDNCPGATVTCVPASGSTFPVGTTTVTCTASDGS
ncbi:MAG: HYR domain-containing protein, partial [Acidobacteria bacterium]|nr:HYR domain-containing protein [Acidobacteriota bacterium]